MTFRNFSLKVSRAQFSHMLSSLETNRLKDIHFMEEEADGSRPVHSWTVQGAESGSFCKKGCVGLMTSYGVS
jgi:hypothetical protein